MPFGASDPFLQQSAISFSRLFPDASIRAPRQAPPHQAEVTSPFPQKGLIAPQGRSSLLLSLVMDGLDTVRTCQTATNRLVHISREPNGPLFRPFVKNDPKREPRGLLANFSKKFREECRKGGLRRTRLYYWRFLRMRGKSSPRAILLSKLLLFFKVVSC